MKTKQKEMEWWEGTFVSDLCLTYKQLSSKLVMQLYTQAGAVYDL